MNVMIILKFQKQTLYISPEEQKFIILVIKKKAVI